MALKAKGIDMKNKGRNLKAIGMTMNELGKLGSLGPKNYINDKILTSKKTGGMVNSNASINKQTVPGSKGVKSGVNPKATVIPKGKYGMTMKKGGMKKSC